MDDMKELLKNHEAASKIFSEPLCYSKTMKTSKQLIKRLYSDIACMVKKPVYTFDTKASSSIMLFYGMSPASRLDHLRSFDQVAALAQPCDIQRPTTMHGEFSFMYALKSIPMIFASIPFTIRHGWGIRDWLCLLSHWLQVCHFKEFVNNLNFAKYQLIVVYFDANSCSSALVQIAKQKGCDTATLMHGIFNAPKEHPQNIDETGFSFTASTANHFLAWNQFSKDEAMKSGIAEHKIHIVGIPKFIGREVPPQGVPTNCFGVILGWIDNDVENKNLINIANIVAKKLGLKYYLRYHPSFLGNEYANIVTADYQGNLKGSIEEYISQTDFSIVGNSSMIIELLYLGHSAFHLHTPNILDKYENINSISFETADQLVEKMKRSTRLNDREREYLCGPQRPEIYYNAFFEKYHNTEERICGKMTIDKGDV